MFTTEIALTEKILQVCLGRAEIHSNLTTLPNAITRLESQNPTSLLPLIDEIIQERCEIPGTCILEYTSKSYSLACVEIDKNFNKSIEKIAEFINAVKFSILKHADLSISAPERFPNQIPLSCMYGFCTSAFRIMYYLENQGSIQFLLLLFPRWNQENPNFSKEVSKMLRVQLKGKVNHCNLLQDSPLSLMKIFKEMIINNIIPLEELKNTIRSSQSDGTQIENDSILGLFFSISLFPKRESLMKYTNLPASPDSIRDLISQEFSEIKTENQFKKVAEKYSKIVSTYTEALIDLVKFLMKPNIRLIMDWFKDAIKGNLIKSEIKPIDHLSLKFSHSSDGFCLNFLDILLNFSEPFLDITDPRLGKIHKNYMKNDLCILQDVPICSEAIGNALVPEEVGTVTEFYYFSMLMFHYGWHSLLKLRNVVHETQKIYKKKDTEIDKCNAKYFEDLSNCCLLNLVNSIRNVKLVKLSIVTLHLILQWCGFNGTLPLNAPDPCLGVIPEYFLNDIAEFFLFLINKDVVTLAQLTTEHYANFITYLTVIIASPIHFSNIGIRGKFIKCLSYLFSCNFIQNPQYLASNTIVFKNYIMAALLKFFVDVEITGEHNQFYEKFTHRHYCFTIFNNVLWKNPFFQQQIKSYKNELFFNRFINMILNDITFFFDEGTELIKNIKDFQNTSPLTSEQKEELSQKESSCRYYMQQINEFMSMVELLSTWHSELFISNEFGGRTAVMLNSFLQKLNGPSCLKLKVNNPKELKFEPGELLAASIRIFVNLSRHEEFLVFVKRDERNFSFSLFEKTEKILMKKHFVTLNERDGFVELIEKLKKVEESQKVFEFDEVPEEFQCGFTNDLMTNPVILPSGKVVDKANIVRHLLTSQNDPFSRQPLSISDLVEDNVLAEKIKKWIEAQMGK